MFLFVFICFYLTTFKKNIVVLYHHLAQGYLIWFNHTHTHTHSSPFLQLLLSLQAVVVVSSGRLFCNHSMLWDFSSRRKTILLPSVRNHYFQSNTGAASVAQGYDQHFQDARHLPSTKKAETVPQICPQGVWFVWFRMSLLLLRVIHFNKLQSRNRFLLFLHYMTVSFFRHVLVSFLVIFFWRPPLILILSLIF